MLLMIGNTAQRAFDWLYDKSFDADDLISRMCNKPLLKAILLLPVTALMLFATVVFIVVPALFCAVIATCFPTSAED